MIFKMQCVEGNLKKPLFCLNTKFNVSKNLFIVWLVLFMRESQPWILQRKYSNCTLGMTFVNISASCSFVSIDLILRILFLTCCLKWWYFTAMCLVWGQYLGLLANYLAPSLSSNMVHLTVDCGVGSLRINNSSSNSSRKGIISRVDWDRAIYSASVVMRAISVYNLIFHILGQPL